MANRIATLTDFAPLAPPWQLTALDQNSTNIQNAFNDASLGYVNGIATDTGSANNYIVTPNYGTPTAYNQGMTVSFIPANTNNGASTLTVSPLGSISITDTNGNAIGPNVIIAGRMVTVVYIGTSFRMVSLPIPVLFQNPIVTTPGTTTINCAGYSQVAIVFDASTGTSGAYTINITNVNWGTHFDVFILTGGAGKNFKWSGTDQATNTITPISALYPVAPGGGGLCTFPTVSLTTTGDSAPTFIVYTGFLAFKPTVSQLAEIRFNAMFN